MSALVFILKYSKISYLNKKVAKQLKYLSYKKKQLTFKAELNVKSTELVCK